MNGVSLTTTGWLVLAVMALAVVALLARYFVSVAMELTRVLLVVGGILLVVVVLWLLFGR